MSETLSQAAAPPAPPSEGQNLVDELVAQSNELVLMQRLVAALRSGIISTPAPSAKKVAQISRPKRSVPFFAGMDIVKQSNAAAIKAMKADVEDIARIFAVDLSPAIAEHREEQADVAAIGG